MENEKRSYLLIENKKKGYFTLLGAVAIGILSLTILMPITYWMFNKYMINRKFIDDRRLKFTGKLWAYFVIYYIGTALLVGSVLLIELLLNHYNLKNSIPHHFLNAIPGVLVSLFVKIWIDKYTIKSTHFVDIENGKSGFRFKIWLFLGKYVLTKLVKTLSLWFLYPISSRMSRLYDYKRCYIDCYTFNYHFSLKKTYPRWLLDLLLTVVTLSIYLPSALLRRYSIDQEFVHIKEENEIKKK